MRQNKEAIDELEEKFQTEIGLLLGSPTDLGSCKRIASRIIPMLLNHPLTKELVSQWDEQNRDAGLLVRAYSELDAACQQILQRGNANPGWSEGVKKILEEVSQEGSCLNITDKNREGICVDTKGEKSIINIPIAEPPCHRVYYKLRDLYVLAVAKTHDMTFAPSACRVIKQSGRGEVAINIDSDPRHMWNQLRFFEECWVIRDDGCCINWPKANGNEVEMWLDADRNFRKAYRCRLSSDFSFSNHYGPNRKMEFFQREALEHLVSRLFAEIILLRRLTSKKKSKSISHTSRIDPRLDDQQNGIEKMRGYFEKHPDAKLGDAADWLDKQVKKGDVVIKFPRRVSTYKTWAREAGLQPLSARFRGKDKSPRKKLDKL